MGLITSVAAAVRTHQRRFSGTKGRPWMVVNQEGVDRVNQAMWSPESVGSLQRAQSYYYFQRLPTEGTGELHDDAIGPGDLYVRFATNTNDLWEPELAIVWARSKEKGLIPLAMEMDLAQGLSGNSQEGVVSIPVQRVEMGADDWEIRRMLLVVVTYDAPYSGTDDPIWLRVHTDAGRVAYHVITDTPQTDLEINTANIYEVPVDEPFTRAQLKESEAGEITLGILGSDKWVPKKIVLFGLDHPTESPRYVVPLVQMYEPGPLSADPTEGVPAITLSLED